MGFAAVLAILQDLLILLEIKNGGFRFRPERTICAVLWQTVAKLQQQLLQGLYIRSGHAFLEQTAAQRHIQRGILLMGRTVVVVYERQLEPARPAASGDLRLDAATIEALPFDSAATAHRIAHMAILVQCKAHNIRKGVEGAPIHALGLRIAEHAVGRFVRASICSVLAGEDVVRADGVKNTLTAVRPRIALAAAHTVCAHLLVLDVLPVSRSAAGAVVAGVLRGLAGAQVFRAFVDHRAVPVGLAHHAEAEGCKVLIRKRRVDSLCHTSSSKRKSDGYSPSPGLVVLSLSLRLCSCARISLSFSGMGSPRWPAFSSTETPSLDR